MIPGRAHPFITLLLAVLALTLPATARRGVHVNATRSSIATTLLHGRSLLQYGDWLTVHTVRPCSVNLGCYGRLGNQLLSVFCAMHAARTLHTTVHLSGGSECYSGLLKKDPLTIPFGPTDDTCMESLDVNGWFGRPSVDPHDTDARNDFAYLYAAMEWPAERPAANELVIYLRAGDIFVEKGPDYYLWAPCSFFDRIIHDTGFTEDKISLVTDINHKNGQNPCTGYLRKRYPRMKLVSVDVGHDFSYLVHATHLVIGGVSTFSQLAAFLSPSLRHVYLFSWSEKDNNNAVIETVWASMGYFDWPGVIPHHYLVSNYTAKLSQAIDIMTTFPSENIIAYSGAEYWHQYMLRGINTLNPWVPFTITLLVPCGKDKASTLQTLKELRLPWEAMPGQNIQRSVPLCVFAPDGWQDMLTEFDHPMKYYRAVMTPSPQHPANKHLLTGNLKACSSELPLAYALQALTANPFRTTHFMYLAHESMLETVMQRLPRLIKRDMQAMIFLSRMAPDGSEREEIVASVMPSIMFRPAALKHEWVYRAEAGMLFHDWLSHEKMRAEHRNVYWHTA